MEDAVFKSLFSLAELILANSAKRTLKILGKILPYIAYVFHFIISFFVFILHPYYIHFL